MSKVISIINVKGGVGKTTSILNLAGEFAHQGKKVLLIDNDSQSNLTQILNVNCTYNLYHLYSNPKIQFSDCITRYNDNIDLIPNSIESASLEKDLQNRMKREIILKGKYEKFKHDYDVVLIDNSPFMGLCTTNAMAMSDYYIVVVDNSTSSLQGLNLVNRLVDELKESEVNSDIKLLGILRNNFDRKTNFTKQLNEAVNEVLEEELFKTIVYNSIKYKESVATNKTIQEYNKKLAEPYKSLYDEIMLKINI